MLGPAHVWGSRAGEIIELLDDGQRARVRLDGPIFRDHNRPDLGKSDVFDVNTEDLTPERGPTVRAVGDTNQ